MGVAEDHLRREVVPAEIAHHLSIGPQHIRRRSMTLHGLKPNCLAGRRPSERCSTSCAARQADRARGAPGRELRRLRLRVPMRSGAPLARRRHRKSSIVSASAGRSPAARQTAPVSSRSAGDHLQLDRGAELAHDDVVIVVSAGEDDPHAGHLLLQEREESIRPRECVLHRGEQEVERITEQDQLVRVVERVVDPVTGLLVLEQRLSFPSAEVRIGDDQCPHRRPQLASANLRLGSFASAK
jgi:hypothetical protein